MQWLWQLIVSILLGAFAGWAGGKLMKSEGSFLRNVILGIVGGALGGWLGGLIGIGGGWVFSLLLAIAGSCLLIFLWRLIFKK